MVEEKKILTSARETERGTEDLLYVSCGPVPGPWRTDPLHVPWGLQADLSDGP